MVGGRRRGVSRPGSQSLAYRMTKRSILIAQSNPNGTHALIAQINPC